MAPLHGHLSYFAIDDSAGTLRNISTSCTSVNFEQDNDLHDVTGFGAEAHAFIVGLTNGKIQVQGFWDKTALTGTETVFNSLLGVEGTTFSVEYGPEGNTTGKVKKTCEVQLESYAESDPVADIVTFSVSLQITGAVTKTTF